ncbi:GtrA family protein [Marinagarivorans algicola]|uniref:GtrA family protein n=1 Tax=Marinagarivorans algicola TaxID=1513270 RepID=UPI0037367E76
MIKYTTFIQLIRFGVVGGGAAAIHFGIALMLTEKIGASIQIANLMGFWVGFVASYAGQVLFTFQKAPSRANFLLYFGLGLVNYCVACCLVFVSGLWLPTWAVFACTVALIPLFGFWVNRFWIFR